MRRLGRMQITVTKSFLQNYRPDRFFAFSRLILLSMTLGSTLSDLWRRFQGELFPALAEAVGPLLETHKRFVTALDLVKVEGFVDGVWTGPGRPREDRQALARGFIAKAVWDLPTTRHLIDRLKVDPTLRRLCGWSRVAKIPREATFSRAFIDVNPRRDKDLKEARDREARARRAIGHVDPETVRFRIRSGVERTNARLKDECGGRHVRVRGHSRVACHLMFGILALAADPLIRLAVP